MNRLDREKKLLYRSVHRGCKETDILLGEFAEYRLNRLTDNELDIYEQLLEVNDVDIYNWLTGSSQIPANYDNSLFKKIADFNKEQCARKINTKSF